MASLPAPVLEILRSYRTCELTTVSKGGAPSTWPLCARLLDDGRFLLTTSIGLPQKAFNIRQNPKVGLLFSEPKGSGVTRPGAVLVQGNATAEDRIVTNMAAVPELEAYFVENIFGRQPGGKMMSSWFGKWMMWPYYMRILLYVTPTRIRYWPTRDFSLPPEEVEVPRVG
jgi:general stress protein 26